MDTRTHAGQTDTPHKRTPGVSLEFDALAHRYTLNGRAVPSVTQVLADLIPGWMASEWYLDRGTAVHACAAMVATGIDFHNDPQINGQVSACRKFFAEVNPMVHAVELRLASERYQYAGTMDMICSVKQPRGIVVIDWKASMTKSLPYQLAAYALAYTEETALKVTFGAGVILKDDGTYRMTEIYDLRRYAQKWLALLTAYGVRRECGQEAGEVGGMQ
jgi:hypothetical protein